MAFRRLRNRSWATGSGKYDLLFNDEQTGMLIDEMARLIYRESADEGRQGTMGPLVRASGF